MRPRSNRRLLVVASVVVVVAVVIANLLGRHENSYERMADAITQALAHNDMAPVQKDFNAIDRPELQNRARVGALSDLVGAMGAFKGSKENTPQGLDPGYHQFVETFARGTLVEKYKLDADGKITRFHIAPTSSVNAGP